jgi:hypothetical protein
LVPSAFVVGLALLSLAAKPLWNTGIELDNPPMRTIGVGIMSSIMFYPLYLFLFYVCARLLAVSRHLSYIFTLQVQRHGRNFETAPYPGPVIGGSPIIGTGKTRSPRGTKQRHRRPYD